PKRSGLSKWLLIARVMFSAGTTTMSLTSCSQQRPPQEPPMNKIETLNEKALEAARKAEPVAWRCKDYADGWVVYGEKSAAERHQRNDNCLMQPLYTRPSEQAVTEAFEQAARIAESHIGEPGLSDN